MSSWWQARYGQSWEPEWQGSQGWRDSSWKGKGKGSKGKSTIQAPISEPNSWSRGTSWKGTGKGKANTSKGTSKGNWIGKPAPVPVAPLRFARGDRVVCNLGDLWIPGTVLDTNVENPQDPQMERIVYVVKIDAVDGRSPTRTIAAPEDTDAVIQRERCFDDQDEGSFAQWCAPLAPPATRKPLRFSAGDRVAVRVKDLPSGFENWSPGLVVSTWTQASSRGLQAMPQAMVPYVVATDSRNYYCHRDDHTLIRKAEHIPQAPQKSISKRFEHRRRPDGVLEILDHVTLRSKVASAESDPAPSCL